MSRRNPSEFRPLGPWLGLAALLGSALGTRALRRAVLVAVWAATVGSTLVAFAVARVTHDDGQLVRYTHYQYPRPDLATFDDLTGSAIYNQVNVIESGAPADGAVIGVPV